MDSQRPLVAVTIGDPAGIGPEVVLGALHGDPELYTLCRPLVVGDSAVIERAAPVLGIQPHIRRVLNPAEGLYEAGTIDLIETGTPDIQQIRIGEVQAVAGQAAFSYIARAIELTLGGDTDAIATAPINKEALQLGGVPFLDHTAMLGKLTNSPHPMTMFTVQNMKIFFATRHESLLAAVSEISADLIYEQLLNANSALEEYGFRGARIAVAALNPHNGEDGIFGREEIEQLMPAIERARQQGIEASGPFAADSVFQRMRDGGCDAVLSLYHDQGHIAAKSVDFYRTIALTPGLPFVRSSVDHGTAFDIAGKGIANPISMAEAIRVAAEYTHRFREAKQAVH
ncbi:MAG TPA: 4-hydroxythreonine-4-phosphate dehydrogenase PdxA [Dehalococcoidia bacterium]|nr:4-hydroxythreonine-4-phosphate dehydrogenase PdxA [Dehalococcoidia bacterium]